MLILQSIYHFLVQYREGLVLLTATPALPRDRPYFRPNTWVAIVADLGAALHYAALRLEWVKLCLSILLWLFRPDPCPRAGRPDPS